MTPTKVKPSGAAYLVPAAIWIVFSVVAVVFAVRGVQQYQTTIDNFARIDSGVATTVELKSAGGYRIWFERPGIGDASFVEARAEITQGDTTIPTRPYDTDLSYTEGSREGVAVLTFTVDRPGEYLFVVEATDGAPARFAIGKVNPLTELGKGIGLMVVIGGLGFLIALVIVIVLAVKRGKAKRAARQADPPPYPPSGYPPPGGYAPGYPPPSGGYAGPGVPGQPGSSPYQAPDAGGYGAPGSSLPGYPPGEPWPGGPPPGEASAYPPAGFPAPPVPGPAGVPSPGDQTVVGPPPAWEPPPLPDPPSSDDPPGPPPLPSSDDPLPPPPPPPPGWGAPPPSG